MSVVQVSLESFALASSLPSFLTSFLSFSSSEAKQVLVDMGVSYEALELNEMGDKGKALRAELAERTGRTSVPNIFIAGEGIGGCNDGPGILTLEKEGKLVPMLQAAGAME